MQTLRSFRASRCFEWSFTLIIRSMLNIVHSFLFTKVSFQHDIFTFTWNADLYPLQDVLVGDLLQQDSITHAEPVSAEVLWLFFWGQCELRHLNYGTRKTKISWNHRNACLQLEESSTHLICQKRPDLETGRWNTSGRPLSMPDTPCVHRPPWGHSPTGHQPSTESAANSEAWRTHWKANCWCC